MIGQERRAENIQKDIALLESYLTEQNPEKFGPRWIWARDKNLQARLLRAVRAGGTLDWSFVIDKLPPPWKERWDNNDDQEAKMLEAEADLKKIFRRAITDGKKKITSQVIGNYDKNLWLRLLRMLRQPDGSVDWWQIVKDLPPELKQYWKNSESKQRRTFAAKESFRQGLIAELLAELREKNPDNFSPIWLEDNASKLYGRLRRAFRQNNKPNWGAITDALSTEWHDRWVPSRKDSEARWLADVATLKKSLEQHKPKLWGSGWIEKLDNALYRRLLSRCSKGGMVQWEKLLEYLEPE